MLIKQIISANLQMDQRTTSELFSVTKGFGALVIGMSRSIQDLSEERISIYVEKASGNFHICQDVLLKDFIALTTFGEDAINNFDGKTFAMCEITEDGGYISLNENETIKIQLSKIFRNDEFVLYGFEEPIATHELTKFERKVMASETLTQDYDLKGYDLLSLEKSSQLQEIQLTFDNGAVTTHLPQELEMFCRSVDSIKGVISSGTLMNEIPNRHIIPLKGIVSIKIKKESGSLLNMHLRIDESDWQLYQRNK